jgi:rare lipoprotein A
MPSLRISPLRIPQWRISQSPGQCSARSVALLVAFSVALLAGCGSAPKPSSPPTPEAAPPPPTTSATRPATSPRGGAYYKDDGPGEAIPPNLENTPNAVPRDEPLHRAANRPYVVFGQQYVPDTSGRAVKQRGVASWYGKKFHGQRTSSGEIYDMFAMTAAHPTLPIPSYVKVTHVGNGNAVIVRVNDRGPFHANRIIDLSYTAALKLGYVNQGSATVEVEMVRAGATAPPPTVARNLPAPVPASSAAPSPGPASAPASTSAAPARAAAPATASTSGTSGTSGTTASAASTPAGSSAPSAASAQQVRSTFPASSTAPSASAAPPPAAAATPAQNPASTGSSAPSPMPSASASVSPASGSPAPVAARTADAPPPVVLPTSRQPDGTYLQLGAFSTRANAETLKEKIQRDLPWLVETIYIVGSEQTAASVFRVQVGPYATRDAAQATADKLRDALEFKPSFVVR